MSKFYGVRRGRKRGVYTTWPEAQEQVALFPGAEVKSFPTLAQAKAYVGRHFDDKADSVPYIEIHVEGRMKVIKLTDKLRRALLAAGVDLTSH